MFGVVPKPLWNRKSPADEFNRIQLDTNCLLIKGPDILAICDTGFGPKLNEKEKTHIDSAASRTLIDNLADKEISPEDITHVIFSHLHFDHAGGATCFASKGSDSADELAVSFPNATHVMQAKEIEDALGRVPELEGNYYDTELGFLRDQATCEIVDGTVDLLPAIKLVPTGGHTFGHQTIWIHGNERSGVYLGDICPTVAHLNVFWTMAYDAFQLEVRRKKFELFSKIAEEKSVIFFDHDPEVRAATIRAKNSKAFEIEEVFEIR